MASLSDTKTWTGRVCTPDVTTCLSSVMGKGSLSPTQLSLAQCVSCLSLTSAEPLPTPPPPC